MSLPCPSLALPLPLPTVWESSPVRLNEPPLALLPPCFLSDPGRLRPDSAVMFIPSSLSQPEDTAKRGAACELIRFLDEARSRLVLFLGRGVVDGFLADALLSKADLTSEVELDGWDLFAYNDEPRGATVELEGVVERAMAGDSYRRGGRVSRAMSAVEPRRRARRGQRERGRPRGEGSWTKRG